MFQLPFVIAVSGCMARVEVAPATRLPQHCVCEKHRVGGDAFAIANRHSSQPLSISGYNEN